jgi:hypothetical protein
MKIQIEYNTDNASFEDNPDETLLVLHRAFKIIERKPLWTGDLGKLTDSNGNVIGMVKRVEEQEDKPGYVGDESRCHICGGPNH